MDRTTLASKRRPQGAQPTTKSAVRIPRNKKQQEPHRRQASGRIKAAKDSSDLIRVPKREETRDGASLDDDTNARHFTVANVGRNGTLYLKPSRIPPAYFSHTPATPPRTSDGRENVHAEWPNVRESAVSGTWTPRAEGQRNTAINYSVPIPPVSMANMHQRRRTRSHSFSTVDDSVRSPTFDQGDFQILLNGRDAAQRPKSSADLTSGFLDLRIPHYRLGTPRFSERGTAYLHNSIYSTSDVRSSVFSRADYDKLFPAPPGREHGATYLSRTSSASPYLHPSHATMTPTRMSPTPSSLPPGIHPGVYDRVESSINDPTFVRYSPTTGRITAATPARLIAQITSPLFLDYELLADFFLTYRSFLKSRDLLEYLLGRMQWALTNDSDAGRIVRVRTFVALRHWILNYFADDFLSDLRFRQRFCTLVNEIAQDLRQRTDRGGTDINVIGELKKCWRRTCAMFWSVPDALNTSVDSDILPGQERATPAFGASATSLPLSVPRHGSRPDLDFRRSSQIQLPVQFERTGGVATADKPELAKEVQFQTASIPTSPMSEQSLTVLSCSVPFLRHLRPTKENCGLLRPSGPQRNPPLPEKQGRPTHAHKRSGSFSDALRDRRPPLPSTQPESVDIQSLPSATFTGGLVRGLLLQPSPSKVNILIPLSPALELNSGVVENAYFQDRQQQSAGMKKIVGDVRRVLSSRKGRLDSPASSHRSTDSSDSRLSGQPSAWQELGGPPRVDRLGETIESSYNEAFQHHAERAVAPIDSQNKPGGHAESSKPPHEHHNQLVSSNLKRLDSHVTTGSRSIVIVDDTGVPEMPTINGALPSVSSWSSGIVPRPRYRNAHEALDDIEMEEYHARSGSPTAVASEVQQSASSDPQHYDLLAVPEISYLGVSSGDAPFDSAQARKSSNVHPSAADLPPFRNQLRRRPGGDLKAADHVHDLEPIPRPHTDDSYSTFSQAVTSGTASHELHGTHFSGQGFDILKLQHLFAQEQKDSLELLPTHSSQPNMRPSFEKQVSHIAQLPDRQHEGGIEDALAKLEGKASTSSVNESTATGEYVDPSLPPLARQQRRSAPLRVVNVGPHNDASMAAEEPQVQSPRTDRQGASIYHLSGPEDCHSFTTAGERDANTPILSSPTGREKLPLHGSTPPKRSGKSILSEIQIKDMEHAVEGNDFEKWDSDGRLATPKGSFLLDDNESLSDISTEIADQSGDESLGVRSFFFDDTMEDEAVAVASFRPPPSPPSTVERITAHSPERSPILLPGALDQKRPLKEATSAPKVLPSSNQPNSTLQQKGVLRRVRTSPSQQRTAHLPFVLAFESDVIAEQMTIIEKDALDEVDWKDLIGLNWQQSPCTARNWVDFLKKDSNGIDIVIARFNLVVKWAVSECLLTETPSERAKCITKYIHVAGHCLRLRNYASLYQITLALLSSDLARLHQTWALVAPAEKQMLERFEKLCQPQRNFHHLRSEMETASSDSGCIPFIGLYTHDLMFNAQKPSSIDPPPPGKEKLVNFERYQTAATIVKSLLRLIETSSNYVFHPHPEVLSRCLWLAALGDSEIISRSKTLEQ